MVPDQYHNTRNFYDAWVLSLVIPLVKTAEDNLEHSKTKYKSAELEILKRNFDIPDRYLPEVLDRAESNTKRLFDIGCKAGEAFASQDRVYFSSLSAAIVEPADPPV